VLEGPQLEDTHDAAAHSNFWPAVAATLEGKFQAPVRQESTARARELRRPGTEGSAAPAQV
jgi:hypothetical protein